ncbi:beta-carotene 15,15'-monooxygenase [Sporosarcina sp. 179-K 3D1 HS]|uniref:beta-carotene 15,15'-monooxygenase n=1 Tax=Sporosarcina sp. 179-K 3D1 HS TaxID=3232169 RepID=UPI0039A0A6D5
MVLTLTRYKQWIFGTLLAFTLASNFLIYRLPAVIPAPAYSRGVVFGSLLDLAIIAPLLILAMTRKKGFTVKRFITFMVVGLVVARFIIPASYFEPFQFVPYAAIGLEGVILLAEIGLIVLLAKHMPTILREIKTGSVSGLFAFPAMVKEKVSSHPLISIIIAESLMFYYAIASWKQAPPLEESKFYLHRKTSLIAFYIMLIHAIVIETVGLHWFFHDKSVILSIVLILLNVYTVLYFIAEIQAIRLNPIELGEDKMRVSLGLGKRMEIPYKAIADIISGESANSYKLEEKGLIQFVAKDFEESKPQFVLHFNRPLQATLFMGIEKQYTSAAIRVDEPERFIRALEGKMGN